MRGANAVWFFPAYETPMDSVGAARKEIDRPPSRQVWGRMITDTISSLHQLFHLFHLRAPGFKFWLELHFHALTHSRARHRGLPDPGVILRDSLLANALA